MHLGAEVAGTRLVLAGEEHAGERRDAQLGGGPDRDWVRLFIGAGRFATVTTEAVGLTAGGQRSLLAAYAWLQWLLPAVVFALAAWLGRPRRFRERT